MGSMKNIFVAICSLFFVDCASVEKRNIAIDFNDDSTNVKSEFVISGEISPHLRSEYFGYFNINIKNNSDKWHKLLNLKITFEDEFQNNNTMIVLGDDLSLWYAAQKKIIEINDYNNKVALGVIVGVSQSLAAFSNNEYLTNVGNMATLGAFATYGLGEIEKVRDSLQNSKMIPENHILADNIIIPPGLFSERWVLINSKNHDKMEFITSIILEYQMESGIVEKKKIKFRQKYSSTTPKWQRSIFDTKKLYRPYDNNTYRN
jgi:hypothetical protein